MLLGQVRQDFLRRFVAPECTWTLELFGFIFVSLGKNWRIDQSLLRRARPISPIDQNFKIKD